MQAESAANLFQTDADLHKASFAELRLARTKELGSPINLPSKALALVVDGNDGWVGESGFVIRRIDLESGKTLQLYKGHAGPVTSLALWTPSSTPTHPDPPMLLFSGSWDKTVRIWNTRTATHLTTIAAHADFVKSLLVVPHPSTPVLLTGSSDKTLKVHLLVPLLALALGGDGPTAAVGELICAQTIRTHTRPITCLALGAPAPLLDEQPPPDPEVAETADAVEVFSADSLGRTFVWSLERRGAGEVELTEVRRLGDAKTSVTDLSVCEEGAWVASMDHSVTFHPAPSQRLLSSSLPALPKPAPPASTHPSALSLLHLPFSNPPLLLASYNDAHVRLWSLAEGEGQASVLVAEVEGHAGEIGCLAHWPAKEGGGWIVSAGLDRTVRRWKVADLLRPPPPPPHAAAPPTPSSGMTAEEEAELADLLGSDGDNA